MLRIPAQPLLPYLSTTDRVSYTHFANGKLFQERLPDGEIRSNPGLAQQKVVTVSMAGIERVSLSEPLIFTLPNPEVLSRKCFI